MKILLTAINAKYIHSNLAVYSLKAYSEEIGNVRGIELLETTINNRIEDILDDIYEKKPDVVAFSCYIWNIDYVHTLIPEIRKLLPDTAIWLGGPEVSYNPVEVMKTYPQVDIVMCGEGEETFLELCKSYEKIYKKSYEEIQGIAFRNTEGNIVITESRDALDLSTIPFPYKNIDNLENRIIYYESSRGCPFSCSYCLSSVEKKLRFRDVELVKKELGYFIEKKVPLVKFVDRTFNCSKPHALAIWQYILDNDNGITRFHFEIAADLMDDEEIELISKMRPGLIQLEIGIQSTNDATIHEIKRVMKLEKVKSVVERINSAGNIHQHLDLIAGLPYEDYETFIRSFNDVYKMYPDQLQLGFLKVLTGSYMAENKDNYGIVYKSFAPYEILYSNWISYDEILKLKMVEEVLEIYYNSGQFRFTVKFLENYFDEPFKLYYEVGKYYKDNFPKNVKHSRIDRYNILKNYFEEIETDEAKRKLFCEIMTYDIFLRENMHTRPVFATGLDDYRDEIRVITRAKGLTRSEHVEPISKELMSFLKKYNETKQFANEKIEGVTGEYFVFDYSVRNPLSQDAKVTLMEGDKNA